jgi:hypothetical protein
MMAKKTVIFQLGEFTAALLQLQQEAKKLKM